VEVGEETSTQLASLLCSLVQQVPPRALEVARPSLARKKRPIRPFLQSQAEACFEVRAGQVLNAAQATKRARFFLRELGPT
jgi:hypothetical protein